jgi:predicted TIM-barrel fold metal-dependent hydrolase
MRAIDADGHVQEPTEAIARLLPAHLRDCAPRSAVDAQGRIRQIVGGEWMPYIPVPESGKWEIPAGGHDPKQRLADMDRQGVERSVLFPTFGLAFAGLPRADVQAALCRAYDDWLAEFCAADPHRLLGIAVPPQSDPRAAVAEAKRCIRELGFRGVMLRPNPIAGRTLQHADWAPLWELLEAEGVPLCVHEGTTQEVPQSGRDRFEDFALRHVASHPHEQQLACLGLVMGGVLERHPGLRVVFLESGCGWLPAWLERMDDHAHSWGWAMPKLRLAPSETFARQCFVSCDAGERTLESVVALCGEDVVVFATDYPHPDALAGDVVGRIAQRAGISAAAKQKILRDNARRCFGLAA